MAFNFTMSKSSASLSNTDPSKRLLSDSSSLVDLKAEVFRKHQEAKFNRLHGKDASGYVASSSKDRGDQIWSKKNAGLTLREKRDLDRSEEERRDDARVKEALERKAKLYDQLKDAGGGEEGADADRFLVRFEKNGEDSEEEEDTLSMAPPRDYPARNDGEKFVEYTDSLGRTRTCMKKDLPDLKRQDRELSVDHTEGTVRRPADEVGAGMDMLSEDMRRELLRQKWEKEEEENLRKRNLHYQDVLYDEARTHGAGFYRFSKDEATRADQQDELEQLHKETELARNQADDAKAKRKAAMRARLRKVKDKKRLKMGLPVKESDSDEENEAKKSSQLMEDGGGGKEKDLEESVMESLTAMRKEALEKEREAERNRMVREWDLGKDGVTATKATAKSLAGAYGMKGEKKVMDQKEWVSSKRKERASEFAPPSSYEPARKQKQQQPKQQYRAPPPRSLDALYGKKSKKEEGTPSSAAGPAWPPPPSGYLPTGPVPDFSRPPPGFPPPTASASAPAAPPDPSSTLDPMAALNKGADADVIGPMPRPEDHKRESSEEEEEDEGDVAPPGADLGPVGIGERLKMFREAVTNVGGDFPGPSSSSNSSRGAGAEIAPPCSMGYFANEAKGKSSRGSFKSRKDMEDSFKFGLSSKKPEESAMGKRHHAFDEGGGSDSDSD